MADLTPAHDVLLALLDWLPEDRDADAAPVTELLCIPEAEAARLLDEHEAAGCLASATGPRAVLTAPIRRSRWASPKPPRRREATAPPPRRICAATPPVLPR